MEKMRIWKYVFHKIDAGQVQMKNVEYRIQTSNKSKGSSQKKEKVIIVWYDVPNIVVGYQDANCGGITLDIKQTEMILRKSSDEQLIVLSQTGKRILKILDTFPRTIFGAKT